MLFYGYGLSKSIKYSQNNRVNPLTLLDIMYVIMRKKLGDDMIKLPNEFKNKMKSLLDSEYDEFIDSYNQDRISALRINTLKIDIQNFLSFSPFKLDKVPWTEDGFYYSHPDQPGKHPYHEAGLYYIQEPSAMAVSYVLDSRPGEKVLDLCAAPGGKSTHIAAAMKNTGLLISNEIHPSRAKILSQNIERMGIKNAIVTNESPSSLASRFVGYFHRILVDAPCSGEGMFRKNPLACDEWSPNNVTMCAARQLDILDDAQKMLAPGGILVYSTCTFSPEENERVIERFLTKYNDFELIDSPISFEGFDRGRIQWTETKEVNVDQTIRLWPHRLQGEGHFIAVMRKKDGWETPPIRTTFEDAQSRKLELSKDDMKYYMEFANRYLKTAVKESLIKFGQQLYWLPSKGIPSLKGLKVIRPGWHLGTFMKKRFEPSHALALSLNESHIKQSISFDSSSPSMEAYLRGESIPVPENYKGWVLVMVNGYSIGWGKASNGILKNHYPKGLRWS